MLHAIRFIRLPDSMGINPPQGTFKNRFCFDKPIIRSSFYISAAYPAWHARSAATWTATGLPFDFWQTDYLFNVHRRHLRNAASLGPIQLHQRQCDVRAHQNWKVPQTRFSRDEMNRDRALRIFTCGLSILTAGIGTFINLEEEIDKILDYLDKLYNKFVIFRSRAELRGLLTQFNYF